LASYGHQLIIYKLDSVNYELLISSKLNDSKSKLISPEDIKYALDLLKPILREIKLKIIGIV